MATTIIPQKTLNILEIKGEKFVILKKEYLDELTALMKSFGTGEKLLKEGKTRSFDVFLKTLQARRNK